MKIKNIIEYDDKGPGIIITFEDGSSKLIYDNGQNCCEHRYWTIDDDLNHYIGSEYFGWELSDCEDDEDDLFTIHEIQFLNIKTSIGDINIASHNEHNGYYGGFYIIESEVP